MLCKQLLCIGFVRLGLLDVLLWNVPPQILVGDALWSAVSESQMVFQVLKKAGAVQAGIECGGGAV